MLDTMNAFLTSSTSGMTDFPQCAKQIITIYDKSTINEDE